MSNTVIQAQKLLLSVEEECKRVGLMLNSGKTKSMFLNLDAEELKNGAGDMRSCKPLRRVEIKTFSILAPGATS